MPIKIEHRLGVQAPAAVIWEILEDVPNWPAWNPHYSAASGRVGYGELLKLTLAGPPPRAVEARIVDWTPNELIHVRAASSFGLAVMTRYLEIDVLGEENAIFSNGELFSGWMGERIGRRLRPHLRQAFAAGAEAVKAKAEALWRERSGGTT